MINMKKPSVWTMSNEDLIDELGRIGRWVDAPYGTYERRALGVIAEGVARLLCKVQK